MVNFKLTIYFPALGGGMIKLKANLSSIGSGLPSETELCKRTKSTTTTVASGGVRETFIEKQKMLPTEIIFFFKMFSVKSTLVVFHT